MQEAHIKRVRANRKHTSHPVKNINLRAAWSPVSLRLSVEKASSPTAKRQKIAMFSIIPKSSTFLDLLAFSIGLLL